MSEATQSRDETYLRTLLLLLVAATFFEGYDGAILALVLPDIQDTFSVAESQLGVSRAIIELGLGAAFFLARAGDRWGRRKLLLWSVLGYTVMTTLTAFSWDLWSFTAFQSLSRVFLGAEYAAALTMIVEEFPKERRARAIGTLLMMAAVGAVAVALLLLIGVDQGPWEWRTLYLIGVIPLLFLAVFRRQLKETRRFEEHQAQATDERVGFWEPWRPAFRRTLVFVGVVHLFRSLPLFGATAWFFFYAEREAGLESSFLYAIFIVAYGFGTVGYCVCGRLMDRFGRRPTAIVYGLMAGFSSILLFQATEPLHLGLLLVLAVFFGLGMAPVLGAISTELFPTYIRNQSAAWARNIFEIAGFILGPLLVGVLGDHYTGTLGSVGDTVSILVLLFFPATYLLWRHLPETRGRELEEIEADLGIDEDGIVPGASGPRRFGWVGATFAVTIVTGLVFLGVTTLGGIVRRPEGAAERYLQAVSGSGEVERFGSPTIGEQLFGDADDFDTIEIGQASQFGSLWRVPFRVEKDDDVSAGILLVQPEGVSDPQEWRVVGFAPRLTTEEKATPSEGGPPPAGAPGSAWPLAIAVVVALTVGSEVLLRILRRSAPATTPRE